MKNIIKHIFCLGIIILGSSCHRQKLYDPTLIYAKIPIVIDWSKSGVDPTTINHVSVHFYSRIGAEPIVTYSTDPYLVVVTAREGVYDIVIHNEIDGNIKGVQCNNVGLFEPYNFMLDEINAMPASMLYKPTDGQEFIYECEPLASWSGEGFEVTESMIKYTRTSSFEQFTSKLRSRSLEKIQQIKNATKADYSGVPETLTKALSDEYTNLRDTVNNNVTDALEELNGIFPLPLTATYDVEIEFENINNMQYFEAVMNGFMDGAVVHDREKILPKNENFNISEIQSSHLSDSIHGWVGYKFTNFGHDFDNLSKVSVTVNVVLQNGTLFTEERDVTAQVSKYIPADTVFIKIGDSFNNNTETIELPASDVGEFRVEEWDDVENVVL